MSGRHAELAAASGVGVRFALAKSTVGAQVIIDDTVISSKDQAAIGLEIALQKIMGDTWPPA